MIAAARGALAGAIGLFGIGADAAEIQMLGLGRATFIEETKGTMFCLSRSLIRKASASDNDGVAVDYICVDLVSRDSFCEVCSAAAKSNGWIYYLGLRRRWSCKTLDNVVLHVHIQYGATTCGGQEIDGLRETLGWFTSRIKYGYYDIQGCICGDCADYTCIGRPNPGAITSGGGIPTDLIAVPGERRSFGHFSDLVLRVRMGVFQRPVEYYIGGSGENNRKDKQAYRNFFTKGALVVVGLLLNLCGFQSISYAVDRSKMTFVILAFFLHTVGVATILYVIGFFDPF